MIKHSILIENNPHIVHATTRGTVRLVYPYKGQWLVFFGHGRPYDPALPQIGTHDYSFSPDGIYWSGCLSGKARANLVIGDNVFNYGGFRPGEGRGETYKQRMEYPQNFKDKIVKGVIENYKIRWVEEHTLDEHIGYYPDLLMDSTGRFTVAGRTLHWHNYPKRLGTVIWKSTGDVQSDLVTSQIGSHQYDA